jgi:hypothetical protein
MPLCCSAELGGCSAELGNCSAELGDCSADFGLVAEPLPVPDRTKVGHLVCVSDGFFHSWTTTSMKIASSMKVFMLTKHCLRDVVGSVQLFRDF